MFENSQMLNQKNNLSSLIPLIAPSLLSADFANLGAEVTNVIQAGADLIHFDVMDQHYVPNLTFGPMICQALKPYAEKLNCPIDVHLMVQPVDFLIESFAKAGADWISFHPEASNHVHRSLQLIQNHGVKAGLALNPATSLSVLDYLWDELDFILVMSVNPGFGGQKFIQNTLEKLKIIHEKIIAHEQKTGKRIRLEVDGGVNTQNIGEIAQAGADTFVAGSAIFNVENKNIAGYKNVIDAMKLACL